MDHSGKHDGAPEDREVTPWGVALRPSGALDAWTAWELRHALAAEVAQGARWLVVDLSGVDHVDGAGVKVLVGARALLARRGGALLVVHADDRVQRLLRLHDQLSLLDVPVSPPLQVPADAPAPAGSGDAPALPAPGAVPSPAPVREVPTAAPDAVTAPPAVTRVLRRRRSPAGSR